MFIIDDFSRCVLVYLLKHKFETFVNFKNWKVNVENQTGQKVKYLHTDNGLEIYNAKFDNLFNESSITRKRTVPYSPQ